MERIYSTLSKVVIAAVLALNVYRAIRTPITAPEAYAFDHFVRPALVDQIREFDPQNQPLQTVLTKRAVGLLRLSEFSMRLPALLGAAFFLWAAFRILRRWLGERPVVFATILVLTAKPIATNLWLGQGDVDALALLAWGIDRLQNRKLQQAGVLLGLAPAASLLFAIPAALVLGIAWRRHAALTAIVVAFIALSIPLSRAESLDWHFRLRAQPQQTIDVRPVVQQLRDAASSRPIRIAADPQLQPLLHFYQARDRISSWDPAFGQLGQPGFDYSVVIGPNGAEVRDGPK